MKLDFSIGGTRVGPTWTMHEHKIAREDIGFEMNPAAFIDTATWWIYMARQAGWQLFDEQGHEIDFEGQCKLWAKRLLGQK